MTDLYKLHGNLMPATTPEALEKILEKEAQMMGNADGERAAAAAIQMEHALHAGMYARTARLPMGALIIGTLVKIPTLLIVNGHAKIFAGDRWHTIEGFQVIAGAAGRKQVFAAYSELEITMIFPTQARTVEEAEAEFTDEVDKLMTRRYEDKACQE